MPLVVFSLLLLFAFMALSIDVMRQFYSIERLRYAARAAALDILPFACLDGAGNPDNVAVCNPTGDMQANTSVNLNMALARDGGPNAAGAQVNTAPAGSAVDSSRPADQPVLIDSADIRSAAATDDELTDKSELVLRVMARRNGGDALQMAFMPVLFAVTGGAVPPEARRRDQAGLAEVIGQPATRIGAAVPEGATAVRNQAIYRGRLATFPVGLEYADFVGALPAAAAAPPVVSVRVVDPGAASPPSSGTTLLRGYFLNDSAGSNVSGYYSDARTPPRFDELIGLLRYFDRSAGPPVPQAVRYPRAVESGVSLDCFNSTITSFNNNDLRSVVSSLASTALNRCFILPVVEHAAGQPSSQISVRGFSWLKLRGVSELSPGVWNFAFEINESMPLLNCSCTGGMRSIPAVSGQRMAAPPTNGPFHMRRLLSGGNILEPRSRGVVLAPAVSPRVVRAADEV